MPSSLDQRLGPPDVVQVVLGHTLEDAADGPLSKVDVAGVAAQVLGGEVGKEHAHARVDVFPGRQNGF
jgi:hypothetical protein